MVEKNLDRYRFLNQTRIRFVIDVLFHVLDIYNEVFILNCFPLFF